jgi:phosphoribosyl 1,2-cyclic phosphodiesterase
MEALPLIPDQASEEEPEAEVLSGPLIQARIWGARGSVPTPLPSTCRYGGNTACVELDFSNKQRIILDAGTGIRSLGIALARSHAPARDYHIFLSHFHWDHLQGLPFFPPIYNPASTITFYSSRRPEELREILHRQMVTPYFPVLFDDLAASMRFIEICEQPLVLGEVEISSFELTHPQGAHGYRVSHRDRTVVYATDHEHGEREADRRLLHAARGADVLFYDAQFTPEEYQSHRGWGHGTWLEAVRVGAKAGVKQLVLFHHDPGHDDLQIDRMLEDARSHFPDTVAAMEGDTISVS